MTAEDWMDRGSVQGFRFPRWLAWWSGGAAVAVCLAILTLWGTHGPAYIVDLIAAYCF